FGPVREVVQPDENRPRERAGELRGHESNHLFRRDRVGGEDDLGEWADGIDEARSADGARRVDASHDTGRPAGGDDNPAGVLSLRFAQQHTRDDPTAHEDEDHRPQKLAEVFVAVHGLTPRYRKSFRREYPRRLHVASGSYTFQPTRDAEPEGR